MKLDPPNLRKEVDLPLCKCSISRANGFLGKEVVSDLDEKVLEPAGGWGSDMGGST
jgi:hypothetical protein